MPIDCLGSTPADLLARLDRRREARPSAFSTSTCSACSTTACCASTPPTADDPTATGSCSRRATARRRTTRCSPRKGSSPPRAAGRLRRASTRRSATTPTARWSRASRSRAGSLGHGLPLAVGVALGAARPGPPRRASSACSATASSTRARNHEAIAFAGRAGSTRLTAIVVDNASATLRLARRHRARFAVEGWSTPTVDGRDHDALERGARARRHRAGRTSSSRREVAD